MTTPHRRRFRFSLRTLFVVVTVLGCWLGYNVDIVAERKAAAATIGAHGGGVDFVPYRSASRLSASTAECGPFIEKLHARPRPWAWRLREWLGDAPAGLVVVRLKSDEALAREAFPEAAEIMFLPPEDSPAAQIDRP